MDENVEENEQEQPQISREESLLIFAARIMWLAVASARVAGRPMGEFSAGIGGIAIACGIGEEDWRRICAESATYERLMYEASRNQGVFNA